MELFLINCIIDFDLVISHHRNIKAVLELCIKEFMVEIMVEEILGQAMKLSFETKGHLLKTFMVVGMKVQK